MYFSPLQHPLFILAVVLFITNQVLERYFLFHLPYLHAYLDDLLCMLVLLPILLFLQRNLVFRDPTYTFHVAHIIIAIIACSLYFEVYLPYYYTPKYIADPLDVFAYSVGGFIFWKWMNRPSNVV